MFVFTIGIVLMFMICIMLVVVVFGIGMTVIVFIMVIMGMTSAGNQTDDYSCNYKKFFNHIFSLIIKYLLLELRMHK